VTTDLITRSRAGDEQAFRQLIDPYQRELLVHCYRILGSVQDAEDALQETLLAAWRGLGAFEGRASIRTRLYRVATSRCLIALRSARRRPQTDWPPPELDLPEPTRLGEVVWLEPYPDVLLAGLADGSPTPRPGTRPGKPSRWPSSRPCNSCRPASVPSLCYATSWASKPARSPGSLKPPRNR
jgi:DNA-directed RNA polymerase specialized sigma subunit, sigma24 homolog